MEGLDASDGAGTKSSMRRTCGYTGVGPLERTVFRWLIYFLRGVQIQAEDAIDRMEEIDGLFEDWRKALAGVQSGRPETVLRLFIGNPFWTAGGIAKELGVAYTTARRAIERLEAAGIVSQTGTAKRNRVYCAREMLEVLEAPHAAGRPASKSGATFGVGA